MPTFAYVTPNAGRLWHMHGPEGWHWAEDNHPDFGASHLENIATRPVWWRDRTTWENRDWGRINYYVGQDTLDRYIAELSPYVGKHKRPTRLPVQITRNVVTGVWEWQPINQRKFGVEIECLMNINDFKREAALLGLTVRSESYNHDTRQHWKLVTDSSIQQNAASRRRELVPIELVSPPLHGPGGMEELEKACTALTTVQALVNKSTGLHIHHDARDLTVDNFKALAENYYNAQSAFDSIVAPSRRGYHYAEVFYPAEIDRIKSAENMYDITSAPYTRSKALNLQAYNRHKTVEFRQHQGTIEFKKISAWVMLGKALIDASRDNVIIPPNVSLEAMLETITNDAALKNYYSRRSTELVRSRR